MRLLIILLLLCCHKAFPQNLRLIRGAVIDMTAAQASGPESIYSNYWISGKVTAIYPKCTIIERQKGQKCVFKPKSEEVRYADTAELLSMSAAARLAERNGGSISAGEWYAMSPSLRRYFQFVPNLEQIAIFNQEATTPKMGQQIFVCGISIGKVSLANIRDGTNLTGFDAGVVYEGNILTNKSVYIALPRGLDQRRIKTNAVSTILPTNNVSTNSLSDIPSQIDK